MGKRGKKLSPIFENALDSLRIGMDFFQREGSYSSRKHAILTVFHAIELLLKEQLHRTNPVLIYKNIDQKVTDDSFTVGLKDALVRLHNIGIEIDADQRKIVERIQARRNRIEHHRYDHNEKEDDVIIGEALKFVVYFSELVLGEKIEEHVDPELMDVIKRKVFEYNELRGLAELRFNDWAKKEWPKWNIEKEDTPEEFEGTLDCPRCGQTWMVIGYHKKPFCFWCNVPVDADVCEHCGRSYFVKDGCCSFEGEKEEIA